MNYAGYIGIAACGFMVVCGSAAKTADPLSRLEVYRAEFKSRESGVYEKDGSLFVHVSQPVGNHGNAQRLKAKAVIKANDLLRQWAIDFTATDRKAEVAMPLGMKRLVGMLDEANPLWRFSDWNARFSGQEHSGQDKDVYWLVQIVSKEDVVKMIPDSFRNSAPSKEKAVATLKLLLPQMVNSAAGKVYGRCNAFDLATDCDGDTAAKQEYDRMARALETHLATASFPVAMRHAADSIGAHRKVESWSEVTRAACSSTNLAETVVTNALAGAKEFVVSGQVKQTADDSKERGVSLGGFVQSERLVCTQEEVVVTRTVTMIETRRTLRIRQGSETYGTPQFQRTFLSGGQLECSVSKRLPSGDMAVKTYFDGGTPVVAKETALYDALSENPGDVELWNMLGRCRLAQEDAMSALVCFRAALKIAPANQFALTNLAIVYNKLCCPNLAVGMAILARGFAEDKWCVEKSEEVLFKITIGVGNGRAS